VGLKSWDGYAQGGKNAATSASVKGAAFGIVAFTEMSELPVNLRLPVFRRSSKAMRLIGRGEKLLVKVQKAFERHDFEKGEALLDEARTLYWKAHDRVATDPTDG
jgi:hypothetical protein